MNFFLQLGSRTPRELGGVAVHYRSQIHPLAQRTPAVLLGYGTSLANFS